MPTIKIDNFAGIMPKVHPTLLPDACATMAHNCILKDGKLKPLRFPLKVSGMRIRMENGLAAIADAQTLFMWHKASADELLTWPGEVHVAGSNIADDTLSRIFVSGATGIGADNHPGVYIASSVGNGVVRYDLAKAVMPAPVATVPDPGEVDNIRYTVFFQSWVDSYGYESGASLPSNEVEYIDGSQVTIGADTAPAYAVKRRIWKVVSGTQSESIQFVAEQNAVNSRFPTYTFALLDENAGEVLPMYVGMPTDLNWMTRVPGNFFAGFKRSNIREVRFSEVGVPVSWPDAYAYSVHDDIVGLGVTLNSVFVVTTGMPWVLTGTAPESMTAAILASPQGCVAARSICVMEGAVFYVSADGICMLQDGSAGVNVITAKLFSKRDWQALHPETAFMTAYDGALHLWFGATGSRTGYVINLTDGQAAVVTHDEVAKAACVDAETDSLYFVREA